MKDFTELDKELAKKIDKRFKWIARDSNGSLYISVEKPHKASSVTWDCKGVFCLFICDMLATKMYKPITWEDEEPTRISSIYMPPAVLTDSEQEYLKAVFKPFRNDIDCVRLRFYGKVADGQPCHISAYLRNEDNLAVPYRWLDFPGFIYHKDGMYSGMIPYHDYTLEDLGIYYED